MTDLLEKVNRLAEKAKNTNAERQHEAKQADAMAKARVREISPEIADFLNSIVPAFNVKIIRVTKDKEVIYAKGQFQAERDFKIQIQKSHGRRDYFRFKKGS